MLSQKAQGLGMPDALWCILSYIRHHYVKPPAMNTFIQQRARLNGKVAKFMTLSLKGGGWPGSHLLQIRHCPNDVNSFFMALNYKGLQIIMFPLEQFSSYRRHCHSVVVLQGSPALSMAVIEPRRVVHTCIDMANEHHPYFYFRLQSQYRLWHCKCQNSSS